MKYEKNKVKRKSKIWEKGKVTLLFDFETNVPSETKRRHYLTGTEEIHNVRYKWIKDAVSWRMIINDQLLLVRDFAKRLNKLELKASKGWHFNVYK